MVLVRLRKLKKLLIKNIMWIILFFSMICFLLLAEDVFTHEMMNGDVIGYKIVSDYLIHDALTPIIKGITWWGGPTSLLLITCVLVLFIKNRKIGISIGANLVIITILNQVFKIILQRPRPIEYRIISETGYSFPSGHSMVSMAFYGYFIYLIYKHIKNKYLKWFFITILAFLILLIGLSRIYLGVHYVSDVMAGFAISIAYLILFTKITNKWIGE